MPRRKSDPHSGGIKRHHLRSAGGENPAVRSKFCRHHKRLRTSCRNGENAAVRSTFKLCSHQKRSHTPCRRGRTEQSDRLSGGIKRDPLRSAWGGRTQQLDRHSADIKINHLLSVGENAAVKSPIWCSVTIAYHLAIKVKGIEMFKVTAWIGEFSWSDWWGRWGMVGRRWDNLNSCCYSL